MAVPHRTPSDRCAHALLKLFHKQSNQRLSESEQRFQRDEVNRVLGEMGDEAITQSLNTLYRLAEADARKNARVLTQAIREPQSGSWITNLRRRLWSSDHD